MACQQHAALPVGILGSNGYSRGVGGGIGFSTTFEVDSV